MKADADAKEEEATSEAAAAAENGKVVAIAVPTVIITLKVGATQQLPQQQKRKVDWQ